MKTPAREQGLVGAQLSPPPPPIREVVVAAILAGVLAWIEILTVAGQRRTLSVHTGFAVRPAHPGVQAPEWSGIILSISYGSVNYFSILFFRQANEVLQDLMQKATFLQNDLTICLHPHTFFWRSSSEFPVCQIHL